MAIDTDTAAPAPATSGDPYSQYNGAIVSQPSNSQAIQSPDPYAAYGGAITTDAKPVTATVQPPVSSDPYAAYGGKSSQPADPYSSYGGSVGIPKPVAQAPQKPSIWDRVNAYGMKALEFGLGYDTNVTKQAYQRMETPGVMNRIGGGLEYLLSGVPFAGAPLVRSMEESNVGQYGRAAIDTTEAAAAAIPADRLVDFVVKPATEYLPEAAQALRKAGVVTLVHEASGAPVAHIADTTATADAVKQAIGQPTDSELSQAANAGKAVIIDHPTTPVVSKDAVISDAITKQIAVESALKDHGIDPSTIKTPEDVQRLLADTRDVIAQNLDPRVGTRIGFATQKQLASDLGMSVDDLLARHSGEAWNAEQSIAARALLQSSQQNLLNAAKTAASGSADDMRAFGTALAQHQLVADQIAGIKSEAGRALGSLRIPDAELPQAKITNALMKISPSARAKAAQLLSNLDMNDSRAVNQFVREIEPSTTPQKLWEVYRNALLSSPHVLLVKGASELLLGALETTRMAMGGTFAQARAFVKNQNANVFASDAVYFSRGAFDSLKDFGKVLSGKLDLSMMPDFERYGRKAIKGSIGDIVNTPSTILNRETNLVWLANYRGYLNVLAARAAKAEGLAGDDLTARVAYLASNPSAEMSQTASDFALHNTFQKELGRFGKQVQRTIDAANVGGIPVGRFLVPFYTTPMNILKVSAEYSPYGLARSMVRGDVEGMSRGILGSTIAAGIAYGTATGHISGGLALDWRKREAQEDSGVQPYSIRIGDHWVSLHKLEPLGMVLGLTSDATLALMQDGATPSSQSKAHEAVRYIARNLSDLPFLQTLSNLGEAIDSQDPANAISRFARFQAQSFIPGIVRNSAQIIDPVYRKPQTIPQAVEADIPGLSENVPAEVGANGEPVKRPASALGGINPFPMTQQGSDAAVNEMARLQVAAIPQVKTISIGGEKIQLTPGESSALQVEDEKQFYQWMLQVSQEPEYKTLSDAQKQKLVKAVRSEIAKTRAERLMQLRQSAQPSKQGEPISENVGEFGNELARHLAAHETHGALTEGRTPVVDTLAELADVIRP